jgi:hypothetical protein
VRAFVVSHPPPQATRSAEQGVIALADRDDALALLPRLRRRFCPQRFERKGDRLCLAHRSGKPTVFLSGFMSAGRNHHKAIGTGQDVDLLGFERSIGKAAGEILMFTAARLYGDRFSDKASAAARPAGPSISSTVS